ncbi:hypothetical protein LCGC14_0609080 [marine sediment metagenome]|uniref:Uncharacterized protein n=1 Tax=marine sediment metagenome TaxID=412755 RepID=A0A0F9R8H3_9ZZZZ
MITVTRNPDKGTGMAVCRMCDYGKPRVYYYTIYVSRKDASINGLYLCGTCLRKLRRKLNAMAIR